MNAITSITLLEPDWLLLALAAALVGVIALVASLRSIALVKRYFDHAPAERWRPVARTTAAVFAAVLLTLCLGLVTLALARPASNPQPRTVQRVGRDVVFAIDVSRSMLAQDIRPSRLDRAKLAVSDVLDSVQGDRVGIVAFAGSSVVKCPLTTDYAFARMALDQLSPDSVTRGGTNIGDALLAADALLFAGEDPKTPSERSRTIFIITDGEDHESQPVKAAESIGTRNVRIITIGLGSDLAGAPVPAAPPTQPGRSSPSASGSLIYRGEPVQSKMDPTVLRQIAEASPGGTFLNVGTGNIELDRVYAKLMRDAQSASIGKTESLSYTHWFQVPLAAALICLALEGLTHVRRVRP